MANASTKKQGHVLFVNGDSNGRLTDEAAQVCSLCGIQPKELLAKPLESFQQAAGAQEGEKQFKIFERTRQAKLSVVQRNLMQLRASNTPNKRMQNAITSLAMPNEERHLYSAQGKRFGKSQGAFHSQSNIYGREGSPHSHRGPQDSIDHMDKSRQRWLSVI